MSAIITDQFRILNAENFVASVANTANSYYAFMGLSNPTGSGYGMILRVHHFQLIVLTILIMFMTRCFLANVSPLPTLEDWLGK